MRRPDDPLPRQNMQDQAAEDILDKYRNIKRTSPSERGTTASYDSQGERLHAPTQSLTRTHTRTHTLTHARTHLRTRAQTHARTRLPCVHTASDFVDQLAEVHSFSTTLSDGRRHEQPGDDRVTIKVAAGHRPSTGQSESRVSYLSDRYDTTSRIIVPPSFSVEKLRNRSVMMVQSNPGFKKNTAP